MQDSTEPIFTIFAPFSIIPIECEVLCVASRPRHNFYWTKRDIEIFSLAERDGPEMNPFGYSDNVGREMGSSVKKVGRIPRSECRGEVKLRPFHRGLKQRRSGEREGFDPLQQSSSCEILNSSRLFSSQRQVIHVFFRIAGKTG
jgi:hypothetical protein